MRVKELIEKLKGFDGELEVGYGYDDRGIPLLEKDEYGEDGIYVQDSAFFSYETEKIKRKILWLYS